MHLLAGLGDVIMFQPWYCGTMITNVHIKEIFHILIYHHFTVDPVKL